MNPLPPRPRNRHARLRAWRIVAGYGIFAGLWIVSSDRLLRKLSDHPDIMQQWSVLKGLAFVIVTTALLWFLVRRTYRRIEEGYQSLAVSEHEQRLLAEQLEQERQRLVEAQRVGAVGSWETELRAGGLKVKWSEEMHRIFGTDAATHSPTHAAFLDSVHPDDRERVHKGFLDSLEKEGPFEIDHRIITATGEVKHVVERWRVYRDSKGESSRVVGVCRDDTDRLAAARALQDSESRFREMAENIGEVFYNYDPASNRLLYASPAYERIWGKNRDVVYPDPVSYLEDVLPDDLPVAADAFRRQLEGQRTEAQFRIRRPDGSVRWLSETAAPVVCEAGAVERIVGTIRDITDAKMAEVRLGEHAALLDKARDAIIVRDPEHRVLYWNQGAQSLYGWTPDETLGRSVRELLYQEDSAFQNATRTVLEKGEWSGEITQFTRSGQAVTVDGRWTLMRDVFDRPVTILAINTDITVRKQLEQQFLRAQRMESIGTLAGGIAHDLNNVLSPVIMSVDLLKRRLDDPSDREILDMVGTSARRGADMVQQILSFARGMEGRRAEVHVSTVLNEVVRIIGDTFPKSIDVSLTSPEDLLPVRADSTQLHQVLLNLCLNARDAMPGGGCLKLRAMNSHSGAGPKVRIEVEDDGTGIPQEILSRIFDPFFTSKALGKGTGLGLSTALAIVRGHGGTLEVKTEVGQGTTFSIQLPALGRIEQRPEEEAGPCLTRGRGETVLLVEDEASIRHITRQTLEAYGYEVLDAADGAEAVGLFMRRQYDIDVVVTDMMMPRLDGRALIRELRRIDPAVPIIGVSGITAGAPPDEGAVPVKFLPKPYSTPDLLGLLREVLEAPHPRQSA